MLYNLEFSGGIIIAEFIGPPGIQIHNIGNVHYEIWENGGLVGPFSSPLKIAEYIQSDTVVIRPTLYFHLLKRGLSST